MISHVLCFYLFFHCIVIFYTKSFIFFDLLHLLVPSLFQLNNIDGVCCLVWTRQRCKGQGSIYIDIRLGVLGCARIIYHRINYLQSKHTLGLLDVCFLRQEPGIAVLLAHWMAEIIECFSDTMVGQPSRRVWTRLGGDGRGEAAWISRN